MLSRLFRAKVGSRDPDPAVPPGRRVYAIGDIHGRADLLDRLLQSITADNASRAPAETMLVFLGDLIDRGPDSAGVVERLRRLALDKPDTRFLLGNHEEIFMAAMNGDGRALRAFCRIGGRETVLSYGIAATDYERMSHDDVARALDEVVPAGHVAFLQSFDDALAIGDYLFVHAGVDPARPLDDQKPEDLRWIREPFLGHRGHLAKVVVHGHTIHPEVEWRPHRIGIDTGAYRTGKLTALALEGAERWLLQT